MLNCHTVNYVVILQLFDVGEIFRMCVYGNNNIFIEIKLFYMADRKTEFSALMAD